MILYQALAEPLTVTDIPIDASANSVTSRSFRTLVFVTPLVGYCIYADAGQELAYRKTTDGGQTWGSTVEIDNRNSIASDVWYDQWTPGDSGTKIHIWYIEADTDDVFYTYLDTATDTLGSLVQVFAGSTSVGGITSFVSGAKMRGGNLYCCFDIDVGAEHGTYRSTDGGATWGVRTDLFETGTADWALLFPGNEADPQDCQALYLDISDQEMTLKVHDDSADTNSESAAFMTGVQRGATSGIGQYPFSGSIRHSDGHLIAAVCSFSGDSGNDLRTWDINGTGSITEKTALATNIAQIYYPSVCIESTTGNIYIAYAGKRDGSQTVGTAAGIHYAKSTDGGGTWTAGDQLYSSYAEDWRQTWAPLTGPRFMVAFRDDSTDGLYTNYDHSIVLSVLGSGFRWDVPMALAPRRSRLRLSSLAEPIIQPVTVTPPIQFDAVSNSGYQSINSGYTWSHTCAGSNRFLAVDIAFFSGVRTVVSITYDGVAMSIVKVQSHATAGRVECWGLANPNSGTHDIVVVLSGSTDSSGCAVSYANVHQATPTEGPNGAQATNVGAADATVDITSTADQCRIHAAVSTTDGDITAGQTARNEVNGLGGSGANEDFGPQSPGAKTMTYTDIGALANWSIAGYAIRPLTAADAAWTEAPYIVSPRAPTRPKLWPLGAFVFQAVSADIRPFEISWLPIYPAAPKRTKLWPLGAFRFGGHTGDFVEPAEVVVSMWFVQASEPVRQPRPMPAGMGGNFLPLPLVGETVTVDKWIVENPKPLARKIVVQQIESVWITVSDVGFRRLLVPNIRSSDRTLRQHTDMVAQILNSLIRQGILVQTADVEWTLDL